MSGMIVRMAMVGEALQARELAPDFEKKLNRWSRRKLDSENSYIHSWVAANSRPSKDGVLRIKDGGIKKLAQIYHGSPVMRNHDMMWAFSMPIGTVFDTDTQPGKRDSTELVLDFAMSKGASVCDDAHRLIQDGHWRESSIHALFSTVDCSVCGKTLNPDGEEPCREHVPGEQYGRETCRVELDDPLEAPEFSLCWSGRLEGTRALAREVPGTETVGALMARRATWLESLRTGRTSNGSRWLDGVFGKS